MGESISCDPDRCCGQRGQADGSGRGLIALALAGAGARVVACDLADEGLAETAALAGQGCTARRLDVTDEAAVARLASDLAAAGTPAGILVNNAGGVLGQVGRPIEAVTRRDWQAIVDVNLTGAFLMAQAMAPAMKAAGWGRIVNISSGAGLGISLTGIQAYASAKAGQIGLTRQLAHELGPFGITVNKRRAGLRAVEPHDGAPVGRDGRGRPGEAPPGHRPETARHPAGYRGGSPVLRFGPGGLDQRAGPRRRRRQVTPRAARAARPGRGGCTPAGPGAAGRRRAGRDRGGASNPVPGCGSVVGDVPPARREEEGCARAVPPRASLPRRSGDGPVGSAGVGRVA